MIYFSETVRAVLAGRVVRVEQLFHADFASGAVRTWSGFGSLSAGGHEWLGSGGLVSVSDIDASAGAFAAAFTLTLAGLPVESFDAYAKLMAADVAEYKGRLARVYWQFFDDNDQTLDQPYAVSSGFMDMPSFEEDQAGRRITLLCEGPFVTRKKTRWSFLTDTDQRRRHADDPSLEFVAAAVGKQVRGPVA